MPPRKKTSDPKPTGVMDRIEPVDMDVLVLDDRNPRVGEVAVIAESLREFGQHRPVVAQRSSKKIVAGNHMYKAARALGWDKIGVFWVDDDDAKAIRRGIADNATGDRAKWDDPTLKELLEEVGTDVPGIDDKTLARLFKEVEDDAAAPVYPIMAKPGEHYAYVMVVATTTLDAAWMEQAFHIDRERSYKSDKVGPARVVTCRDFRKMVTEMAADVGVGDE